MRFDYDTYIRLKLPRRGVILRGLNAFLSIFVSRILRFFFRNDV